MKMIFSLEKKTLKTLRMILQLTLHFRMLKQATRIAQIRQLRRNSSPASTLTRLWHFIRPLRRSCKTLSAQNSRRKFYLKTLSFDFVIIHREIKRA